MQKVLNKNTNFRIKYLLLYLLKPRDGLRATPEKKFEEGNSKKSEIYLKSIDFLIFFIYKKL